MILLSLIMFFLIITIYMAYKNLMTYFYRQRLFEIRTKLFTFALDNNIKFDTPDYRYLEMKLNSLLYYAENKTMSEFLIFKLFIYKKFKRIVEKHEIKKYEITDIRLKKLDIDLEKDIVNATIKHLKFGTLTGIIVLLIFVFKVIGKVILEKVKFKPSLLEKFTNLSKMYENKAVIEAWEKTC